VPGRAAAPGSARWWRAPASSARAGDAARGGCPRPRRRRRRPGRGGRRRRRPRRTPPPGRGTRVCPRSDGGEDLLAEPREPGQEVAPLLLEPLHHGGILVAASLALVEPPRLEDLGVVDAGERAGDLVPEVGVSLP